MPTVLILLSVAASLSATAFAHAGIEPGWRVLLILAHLLALAAWYVQSITRPRTLRAQHLIPYPQPAPGSEMYPTAPDQAHERAIKVAGTLARQSVLREAGDLIDVDVRNGTLGTYVTATLTVQGDA